MDRERFWRTLAERLGDAFYVAAFCAALSTKDGAEADRQMWEQAAQALADAQEAIATCTGVRIAPLERVGP